MTKDKDRTPVAQIVMTMCTKCEMELSHVVVALNAAGIVERVKCHTCGTEHKYRPDKKRADKENFQEEYQHRASGSDKDLRKARSEVQREGAVALQDVRIFQE